MTKLFAKDARGLLHEVPADSVEAARAERRVTHFAIGAIDVLWTAEEEATAQADEERHRQEAATAQQAREREAAARAERRSVAEAKLAALGLTPEDIQALLG